MKHLFEQTEEAVSFVDCVLIIIISKDTDCLLGADCLLCPTETQQTDLCQ